MEEGVELGAQSPTCLVRKLFGNWRPESEKSVAMGTRELFISLAPNLFCFLVFPPRVNLFKKKKYSTCKSLVTRTKEHPRIHQRQMKAILQKTHLSRQEKIFRLLEKVWGRMQMEVLEQSLLKPALNLKRTLPPGT